MPLPNNKKGDIVRPREKSSTTSTTSTTTKSSRNTFLSTPGIDIPRRVQGRVSAKFFYCDDSDKFLIRFRPNCCIRASIRLD